MLKEYQTVSSIYGPLMLVESVDDAKFGHIVDVELSDGSIRHGQVLQVERIEDGTDSGKVFLLIRFFEDDKPIVVGFSEIPPRVPDDFLGRVTVKDLSIIKKDPPAPPAEG